MTDINIFTKYRKRYEDRQAEEMMIDEFLIQCKTNRGLYASAAERMLLAIGDPQFIDTRKDERLSRIFLNRKIKVYPAFDDFYGMEDTVENIVAFFKHAAQGLEESKQILYLLGPVGGGKCLARGTRITLADGSYKNIEDIVCGDVVVSHNEAKERNFRKVTDTFRIEPKQKYKVTTERGRTIYGAVTHRLFTERNWTQIGELQVGELIAMVNEHEPSKKDLKNYYWDVVTSIENTGVVEEMYDFTVEQNHNYVANDFISHNSSLSERLKELMQQVPIYALKAFNKTKNKWEISPIFESPLGLFDAMEDGKILESTYGIPRRYLKHIPSPWTTKRLAEAEGDISKFKVVKIWPSILNQIGITKVEPGDENNQDISSLVGKVNIRELEEYEQHDPDAYNWAGGLNVSTQGIMEFVEMFKAPIKMLHPLLTATQEGHYNGTEQFGAIPFQGIVLAHSNESEWQTFRNNKTNEAFLDRVYIVKVPYCLRSTEETKIYQKLISNSELANAPIAPGTLEMMAQFSVLTRLKEPANSAIFSKMEIYDGKNLKDKDPKAKSLEEYRDSAGVNEGMDGSSTRFAYKILSRVFNFDAEDQAANPIHLMYVLEKQLQQEQLSPEEEDRRIAFIKGILAPKYAEFLGEELQKAYLESYHEYGQNLFDRYIMYADFWLQDKDYRDSDTGEMFDRDTLNNELEKIEKSAGIANPKDFRNETVGYVIRYRASNGGKSPDWTSYEKLRQVIERKMFASTEDLLPIISFSKKATSEEEEKHNDFVKRLMNKGYTHKQVRLAVEWFMRYRKHN